MLDSILILGLKCTARVALILISVAKLWHQLALTFYNSPFLEMFLDVAAV